MLKEERPREKNMCVCVCMCVYIYYIIYIIYICISIRFYCRNTHESLVTETGQWLFHAKGVCMCVCIVCVVCVFWSL